LLAREVAPLRAALRHPRGAEWVGTFERKRQGDIHLALRGVFDRRTVSEEPNLVLVKRVKEALGAVKQTE